MGVMNDILCPNCQTRNRSEARFCSACGRSLAPELPPVTLFMDPAAAPQPAGQRQTVPLRELAIRDVTPHRASPAEGVATLILDRPGEREPLPEGAMLADRYIIGPPVAAPSGVFGYMAEDTGGAPYGLDCVVRESTDPAALDGELLARGIAPGDGVRPPYDAFTLNLGAPRTFVVLAAGQPFESLTPVPDAAPALEQGASLARGLAAVHAAGLAFNGFDARHLRGDGEAVYLADFNGCAIGMPAACAADVRGLATLIHQMIAGLTGAGEAPPVARLKAVASGREAMSAADLARLLSTGADRLRRPPSFDLRVGRRTDVGRLRELNEDSLLVLDSMWSNKSIGKPLGLFVVADGMGGHEGGEIASGLLVQSVAGRMAELMPRAGAPDTPPDYGAWLADVIQAGNVAVFERSQAAGNDMGTTVVAVLIAGNQAYIAHVGDSRVYLMRPAGLEQITVDHSLVESLVASNQITREEARTHPQANVIYRTIGDKRQVTVDLDQVALEPGDTLLLCSDGLSGMVRDETMQQIVAGAASPQVACDALVDAANAGGGEDNITVILVRLESPA